MGQINIKKTDTPSTPDTDRMGLYFDAAGNANKVDESGTTSLLTTLTTLESITDVPAYPNDGNDYVLVENNDVLTWELFSGGGGGGGTVESVTGDSVDNTDPDNPVVNAIPLSGTDVGSPVTGDIEFEDDFIGFNQTSGLFQNNIWFQQDAGIGLEVGDGTNLSFLSFDILQFSVGSDKSTFRGLQGQSYFGANYTDETYVQKKYVDDEIAAIPTPPEEEIVGTATYNPTMTGTVNLDLSTFTSFYGILTGATTITVTNTPASGESFVRSLKLSSTATEALTLPVAWKVIGTYSADTTVNDFQLEFSNFPTQGLVVSVYINQLP